MKPIGKLYQNFLLLFFVIVSLECIIIPASGLGEGYDINSTALIVSPVLRGEPFHFPGSIPTNPSHEVQVWVFGKHYGILNQVPVNEDNSINWSLETSNLSSGRYYIFVQDSGTDGRFDISWDNKSDNIINKKRDDGFHIIYTFAEARNMYNDDAVTVLRREFNSTGIDDPVSVYSLDIIEPYITINPIGDHAVGDPVTISGTTNFPVNTTLWISSGPRSFTNYPPNYFDGQVQVIQGTDNNLWSIELNTTSFTVDEYTIRVQPVNKDPLFSYAGFNMTARHTSTLQTTPVPPTTMPPDTPALLHHKVTFSNGTSRPTTSAPLPVAVPISAVAICCFFGVIYRKTRATVL